MASCHIVSAQLRQYRQESFAGATADPPNRLDATSPVLGIDMGVARRVSQQFTLPVRSAIRPAVLCRRLTPPALQRAGLLGLGCSRTFWSCIRAFVIDAYARRIIGWRCPAR